MKMKLKNLIRIIIVCYILCFDSSYGLPGQLFNITYIKCHENTEWFTDTNCDLKVNEKNLGVISLETKIIKPISKMMIHVKSYKKKDDDDNDQYENGLYDIKLDACAFLNGKGVNALVSMALQYFKRHISLPYKCPLQGHAELKNITINSESIPISSMPGYYKFIFKGFAENPDIDYGHVELHITTKSLKKEHNKRTMKIIKS